MTTIKVQLSMDAWRHVFSYLDEKNERATGPILLNYRLVNKLFCQLALEAISSLRLGFSVSQTTKLTKKMSVMLARPSSLQSLEIVLRHNFQDFAAFYRLVSQCKELRRLSITVFCASSLDRDSPMISSSPSSLNSYGQGTTPITFLSSLGSTFHGLNGGGLCAIGQSCTKLEDFSLHISRSFTMQDGVTDFLRAFPQIRSLCVRPVESRGNVDVSPMILSSCRCVSPDTLSTIVLPELPPLRKLERLDGSLLSQHPWRVAVSQLSSLREITWRCRVSDVHVKSFAELCKGRPISLSLTKLELLSEHQPAGRDDDDDDFEASTNDVTTTNGTHAMTDSRVILAPRTVTDSGLKYVLETFTNLQHLSISCANVSFSAPGIVASLGRLHKLEVLEFNLCTLFFLADRPQVEEWLLYTLPLLPRTLKHVSMRSCIVPVSGGASAASRRFLDELGVFIMTAFMQALPSLVDVKVDFAAGVPLDDINGFDDDDEYVEWDGNDEYNDDGNIMWDIDEQAGW